MKRIILAPASRYGFETDLWTVGRAHTVLTNRFHDTVAPDTFWRRLREIGLTWQTPERQYFEADTETRRRWQEETIPSIRETLRKTQGILYCEDEASVCLTPLLGKTWAECGKPRKVRVTGGRGSDVGNQSPGAFGVSASPEADYFGRDGRISETTVTTSSESSCGSGDESG